MLISFVFTQYQWCPPVFVGTMAEAEDKPTVEEDQHEDDPNYKAPAQKSVKEIVEADQEDESLRKYKESLLGGAIKEVKPPCECRNSSMFELSTVDVKFYFAVPIW